MAHTLARLRFADLVAGVVARLTTGLDGLTLGRAGFAPAGRQIEISWGHRESSNSHRPAEPGRTETPTRRQSLQLGPSRSLIWSPVHEVTPRDVVWGRPVRPGVVNTFV